MNKNGVYVSCKTCGISIYRSQYYIKNQKTFHCSKKCRDFRVKRPCGFCNKIILIKARQLKNSKGNFCNSKCYGNWRVLWFKNNPEEIERIRTNSTGKKQSKETILKRVLKNKGVKRTQEQKELMRKNARRGALNKSWKGGKSSISYRLRRSVLFREWREYVFARDNWTCQKCKVRGGQLHPHHIKFLSVILGEIFLKTKVYEDIIKFSELWDINNGITLCKNCHKEVHRQVA